MRVCIFEDKFCATKRGFLGVRGFQKERGGNSQNAPSFLLSFVSSLSQKENNIDFSKIMWYIGYANNRITTFRLRLEKSVALICHTCLWLIVRNIGVGVFLVR